MARATLDRYQASAITEMRWAADGSFNCGIGQARFEFQMPKGNSSSVKFIGRIQNGFSKFDLVCETLSNNYDLRINKFCRKLDLSHRFSHKEPSKNLIVVPKWLLWHSEDAVSILSKGNSQMRLSRKIHTTTAQQIDFFGGEPQLRLIPQILTLPGLCCVNIPM